MKLFVDLETGRFVASPGVRSDPRGLNFKREHSGNITVQFCRGAELADLGAGGSVEFEIKNDGRYDDDPLVAAREFTTSGAAGAVYECEPTFDVEALDAAFVVDGDGSNDVAKLSVMAEVRWAASGEGWSRTNTLEMVMENNVVRGGGALRDFVSGVIPGVKATVDILGNDAVLLSDQSGYLDVDGWRLNFHNTDGTGTPGSGALLSWGDASSVTWIELWRACADILNTGALVRHDDKFNLVDSPGVHPTVTGAEVDNDDSEGTPNYPYSDDIWLRLTARKAGVAGDAITYELNDSEDTYDASGTLAGGVDARNLATNDVILTVEPETAYTEAQKAQGLRNLGIGEDLAGEGDVPVTSGLQVWLDVKSIENVPDDGRLGLWKDLSGNGCHARSVGTARPTYHVNVGNGVPGVRFIRLSSQYMTFANETDLTIGDDCTVFTVAARDTVDATRMTLIGCDNLANGFQLEVEDKTASTLISGTWVTISDDMDELDAYLPELVTYRSDGTSDRVMRINGMVMSLDTDSTTSFSADGVKELGRRASSGGATAQQYFSGYMQAVLVYDRTLTDDEVRQVEKWLAGRYQSHLEHPFWLQYDGNGTVASGTNFMQGVFFDGVHHWTVSGSSGTVTFKKWTRSVDTYTLVTTYDKSSDLPSGASQMNGISFHNGSLWVGCNNHSTTPAVGWVLEYDLDTMTLQSTNSVGAHWCEGGAWLNGEYFAIYHDSLDVDRYDAEFNHLGTYTREDRGHADDDDNISQSAMWMVVDGENWLVCPNHQNAGLNPASLEIANSSYVEVDRWTGAGFDKGYRIPAGQVDQGTLGQHTMSQGMAWDIDPTETAGVDTAVIVARRDNSVTQGEVARMTMRRRRGGEVS